MKAFGTVGLVLIAFAGDARAADLVGAMAVKSPPQRSYDWSGFYLGGHVGYAGGSSNWSAKPAGAAGPTAAGSLDLYNAFDGSTGTGSYFAGLQAGYNYVLPSRILLGVEADVSFPNTIAGTAVVSSPANGTANYSEQVELNGTVRGRVGYAPGHWLFYATGGFAWSYDQFGRTQLAGMPAGGTAAPGTTENLFMVPRVGGAVGAGVEVALPSNWTARVEYLFTDYASRGVAFPAGAQSFNSGLTLNQLRLGLVILGSDR